jgi:predicted HTH transcriptional regulator
LGDLPARLFEFYREEASPGGLYGEVNCANFGSESSYRNPVLAEALKVM